MSGGNGQWLRGDNSTVSNLRDGTVTSGTLRGCVAMENCSFQPKQMPP